MTIPPLEQLFVIDIETVPQYPLFVDAPEEQQLLWAEKARTFKSDNTDPEELYERAGIYSEFGKIICISIGFFTQQNSEYKFRVKSLASDDEMELLTEFVQLISKSPRIFAGHNIKEFDIPYICRRLMINQMEVPRSLSFSGLKPWEVNMVDTLNMWRFGDNKNYTSLKLLAYVLGIDSPKTDIDGSQVAEVFYVDGDLDRIVQYCQRDVVTVAQILRRFLNQSLLKPEQIEIIS